MTNIVFTLSADSLHELRMQACKALDLQFKSPLLPPVEPAPEIKPTTAAERKKQEARDKLRGKPAATPKPHRRLATPARSVTSVNLRFRSLRKSAARGAGSRPFSAARVDPLTR